MNAEVFMVNDVTVFLIMMDVASKSRGNTNEKVANGRNGHAFVRMRGGSRSEWMFWRDGKSTKSLSVAIAHLYRKNRFEF